MSYKINSIVNVGRMMTCTCIYSVPVQIAFASKSETLSKHSSQIPMKSQEHKEIQNLKSSFKHSNLAKVWKKWWHRVKPAVVKRGNFTSVCSLKSSHGTEGSSAYSSPQHPNSVPARRPAAASSPSNPTPTLGNWASGEHRLAALLLAATPLPHQPRPGPWELLSKYLMTDLTIYRIFWEI